MIAQGMHARRVAAQEHPPGPLAIYAAPEGGQADGKPRLDSPLADLDGRALEHLLAASVNGDEPARPHSPALSHLRPDRSGKGTPQEILEPEKPCAVLP